MANTDNLTRAARKGPAAGSPSVADPVYQLTFVESSFSLGSLFRQIHGALRAPKITVPKEYYKGEVRLPITEMPAWYMDLPRLIRLALETPKDPIGRFNRRQDKWRILFALPFAVLGAVALWAIEGGDTYIWGFLAGVLVGEAVAAALFKKRKYPPDIFQDYERQAASWVNSLLVHAVAIGAMVLPFWMAHIFKPVKASSKAEIVDISPYLADLPAAAKKAGGGGGGGDRSRTPASKGAVPKFAKDQLAPPMAVIPNITPQLPVQPSLLGPPELKLPQMQANAVWGDPQSISGPASNGPGFGGGIGTGEGPGIGSGKGGGLGPGSDGGTGGGPYSVGGNVSAPIPIYKPDPPYSEEARKAKYQGVVVLVIVVDAQGNVGDVRVVKPLGLGLDEKAEETVHTWKFKPGLRNGAPVPVRMMVEVTFRLF